MSFKAKWRWFQLFKINLIHPEPCILDLRGKNNSV